MIKKIRVLELFGGIGACSHALERLGIEVEIADYVEIDKYAVQSFNAIHGTNFEPQDIKKWDKDVKVDLVMHGSPCQDFSTAGKQAGGDKGSGTRSSLMYETLRIVEKLHPKYVIWENVKNLLSKKHIHNFEAYQEAMEKLGYVNKYKVLNAKNYGVPQNRERVFTISVRKDIAAQGKKFSFPDGFPLEKKLKDILEENVDEKFYLSDKQVHGMTVTDFNQYKLSTLLREKNGVANTIKARFDGCPQCVKDDMKKTAVCNRAVESDLVEPTDVIAVSYSDRRMEEMDKGDIKKANSTDNTVAPCLTTRADCMGICVDETLKIKSANKRGYDEASVGDSVNVQYPDSTTRRGRVGHEVSQTLQTSDTMCVVEPSLLHTVSDKILEEGLAKPNDAIEITFANARLNEVENGELKTQNRKDNSVMSTLKTTPQSLGVCVEDKKYVNPTGYRIRKLTPRECWRLMGFDDSAYEKAEKVNSNTQLYKQAGNSIVVDVLYWILKNLLSDDDELNETQTFEPIVVEKPIEEPKGFFAKIKNKFSRKK